MTLQKENLLINHTASGSAVFYFPFRVDSIDDLVVAFDGAEIVSGFTASLFPGDENGGFITCDTAPANGVIVSIMRRLPLVQLTRYYEGSPFPPETVEGDQDDDRMIDQQLAEEIGRTLRHGPYPGQEQFDAGGKRITGLAYGVDPDDAISVEQAQNDPDIGSGLPGPVGPQAEPFGYDLTPAETAAGITENDIDKAILPGWITRYGADASGLQDSAPAATMAINAASHAYLDGSHPSAVYVPSGDFVCDDDVYGYYDSTNNPNFNPDNKGTGRMIIWGDSAPGYADIDQGNKRGSLLRFTAGHQFLGTRDGGDEAGGADAKQFLLLNFGISANINDYALKLQNSPELQVCRLTVHNAHTDTNVGGVLLNDSFTSSIEHVYCSGPDRNQRTANASTNPGTRTTAWGIGVKYSATEYGGGNVHWRDVNVNGFGKGFELGDDYATAVSNGVAATNHDLFQCQAQYCREGFDIKAGMTTVRLRQCFVEFIYAIDGSPGIGYWVHESAGKGKLNETSNRHGLIELISCSSGTNDKPGDVALKDYHVLLGSSESDPNRSAHGNTVISGMRFGQVPDDVACIRRYNSKENGFLEINKPSVSDNGGKFLVVEPEAQHGLLELKNTEGLSYMSKTADWIVSSADWVTDASPWLAGESDMEADYGTVNGGSPDYDYADARGMPGYGICRVAAGNTQAFRLPSQAKMHAKPIIIQKTEAGNGTVSLDPAAPAWQATTYYKRGDIRSKGGWLFACDIPGTSGATGPTGGSGDGQTDGGVTWNELVNGDHEINGSTSAWSPTMADYDRILLTPRVPNDNSGRIEWFAKVL